MAAVLFDTHQAVKRLHDAGADHTLVEAIVTTFHDSVIQGLATKIDIAELKADIATQHARLIWRLIGAVTALLTIHLALLKLL